MLYRKKESEIINTFHTFSKILQIPLFIGSQSKFLSNKWAYVQCKKTSHHLKETSIEFPNNFCNCCVTLRKCVHECVHYHLHFTDEREVICIIEKSILPRVHMKENTLILCLFKNVDCAFLMSINVFFNDLK